MAKDSALSVSGQLWKPWVAAAVMAGSLIISDMGRQQTSTALAVLTIISGIVVGLSAGAWLLTSVRCPTCAARWYWIAITEDSTFKILGGQLTMPECQRCSYPHESRPSTGSC